jgi:pyruvate/2-oxoglutarate dehydrogenase complex dihydrolipoamide acyltransferase (E2) component
MNRLQCMTMVFWCWVILVIPGLSLATLNDPLTTIEIENSVHFLAADGSAIEVPPGTYTVESAEKWVRLVPGERRDALLIEAEHGTHSLDIDDPLAMAIPGDSNEEADLHYVLLLLPGGQSLEATGTYSGIRPRGFNVGQALNNAKKTASNTYNQAKSTANKAGSAATNAAQQAALQGQQAAQQAQEQAKQAASTAQKAAQSAQSAAMQAKQAVEQSAKQAGQAVSGGVQTQITNIQNNPLVAKLESEIQTLDAVRKLQLEPLFRCIAQASGQASATLPQMVHQFATNPADFGNRLFTDALRQWEQDFRGIMAEQLQILSNPAGGNLQGHQIVDMALRSMDKLAQKQPAAKCLTQFLRPHMTALRNMSVQLQQNMMSQGQRIFDTQVAPVVYSSINKQMGEVLHAGLSLTPAPSQPIRSRGLDGIPSPEAELLPEDDSIRGRGISKGTKEYIKKLLPGLKDIKTIVQATLAYHLLNPQELKTASTHLQTLTGSLNNPAQNQTALQGLQTALDPDSPWTEALYIDIGMEILRVVGNKYLDHTMPGGGAWVVNQGTGLLNLGEVTVADVVQGVAGLVPEVGSFAAMVVRIGPDAVFQLLVRDLLNNSILAGLHFAFDKVMDEAKTAMKENRSMESIKGRAGPLSALLPYLPSKQQVMLLADTHTKDVKKALMEYNESVIRLAETASR